jgi:hypothetical protein
MKDYLFVGWEPSTQFVKEFISLGIKQNQKPLITILCVICGQTIYQVITLWLSSIHAFPPLV